MLDKPWQLWCYYNLDYLDYYVDDMLLIIAAGLVPTFCSDLKCHKTACQSLHALCSLLLCVAESSVT